MTQVLRAALAVVLIGGGLPAWAQGRPPDERAVLGSGVIDGGRPAPPAFLALVFPPRLVMENQLKIGLRPAQEEAIKQAINQTQQRLVDLQWKLEAETEALTTLLAADHVDEAAVVEKLEQVTATEQQVKKENFTLLVRIKNQLDPEQQAKLRELRPASRRFGPPGGMGGGWGPPPPPPEP
jgi:uncharacterized membrane protein